MAKITFYHIDMETRNFIKEPTIYEETTNYWKIFTNFYSDEKNMYPVYAMHNGTCVQAEYSPSSGMGVTCASRVFDYDIDNTWIIYYSNKDVVVSTKILADMDSNISDVRLSVGRSLKNIEEYYINNNKDVEAESNVSFFSVEIHTSSMSDSFFTYGSTFSPSCSIEITPTSLLSIGCYIRIEFMVDGVWQNFGVFYIKTPPEETSEHMSISGVGLMETALSSGAAPEFNAFDYVTIDDLCTSIKDVTGVDVVFEFEDKLKQYPDFWENSRYIMPYHTIESDDGKKYKPLPTSLGSYREYLSVFAIAFHSNVIERNGMVYVTHVDNNDFANDNIYFDENTYAEEPVSKNKYYFCANPISVSSKKIGLRQGGIGFIPFYISENAVDTVILSNSVSSDKYTIVSYPVTIEAESMYLEVNMVHEGILGPAYKYSLRAYAEKIGVNQPFAYYPIDAEFVGYNPLLRAGGTITLKIDGETHHCYLGNVTYSWDGMMSVSVSTPCDIDISGNTSSASGGSFTSQQGTGIPESTLQNMLDGKLITTSSIGAADGLEYNKDTGELKLKSGDKVLATVVIKSGATQIDCIPISVSKVLHATETEVQTNE